MSKKGTRYLVLGYDTWTMDCQLHKMGINVGDAWRCTAPIANLTSITDFLMNKSYDLKGIIISDFHENPNAGAILIGVIGIYKKHGLDTSSLEAYYSEKILSDFDDEEEDIYETIDDLFAAKMSNTVNAGLAKHFLVWADESP